MSDSSPGGGEAEGPCVGEVVWAVACSSVSHWPAAADSMSPLPQATICSSGCCRSLHGGSPLVGRCLVGNVRSSVPSPLISFSAFSLLCCATASLLVYFKETNETESDNWIDNCRNHPLSFCCFFFLSFLNYFDLWNHLDISSAEWLFRFPPSNQIKTRRWLALMALVVETDKMGIRRNNACFLLFS